MGKSTINDLIFGEAKQSQTFSYKTNGGKDVTVKMFYPNVKDKGWMLSMKKFEDNPQDLFVEVLLRADIRDPESNDRLFDSTMRDTIAGSDQDMLIKMAGDWLSLVNRVASDEARKN